MDLFQPVRTFLFAFLAIVLLFLIALFSRYVAILLFVVALIALVARFFMKRNGSEGAAESGRGISSTSLFLILVIVVSVAGFYISNDKVSFGDSDGIASIDNGKVFTADNEENVSVWKSLTKEQKEKYPVLCLPDEDRIRISGGEKGTNVTIALDYEETYPFKITGKKESGSSGVVVTFILEEVEEGGFPVARTGDIYSYNIAENGKWSFCYEDERIDVYPPGSFHTEDGVTTSNLGKEGNLGGVKYAIFMKVHVPPGQVIVLENWRVER